MEIPEKPKTSLLRLFELMDQSTKEINQNILEIELKRNQLKTKKDSLETMQVNFKQLVIFKVTNLGQCFIKQLSTF